MKKVLLGALLVAGSALFAQDVPSNVKKTFQAKFPKAQEAEWMDNEESFDVDFYENNVMKSASFNPAGNTWYPVFRKNLSRKVFVYIIYNFFSLSFKRFNNF